MKSIEQLLDCIEDDIELMGENRIIYLMEVDREVVDYDYLPSADYGEAVTLRDLQTELKKKLAIRESDEASCAKKKLAVLFPGVGYTCDKPLLYYSEKMLRPLGYEILRISYGKLPDKIKGNPELMKQAFETALAFAADQLSCINWDEYADVVFISKSVGTVVSSAYAKMHEKKVRNVLFTPVLQTFLYAGKDSIAFHGLADDWADSEQLILKAKELDIPLYLTEGANHSLETGNLKKDLQILKTVLEQTEHFIVTQV